MAAKESDIFGGLFSAQWDDHVAVYVYGCRRLLTCEPQQLYCDVVSGCCGVLSPASGQKSNLLCHGLEITAHNVFRKVNSIILCVF